MGGLQLSEEQGRRSRGCSPGSPGKSLRQEVNRDMDFNDNQDVVCHGE